MGHRHFVKWSVVCIDPPYDLQIAGERALVIGRHWSGKWEVELERTRAHYRLWGNWLRLVAGPSAWKLLGVVGFDREGEDLPRWRRKSLKHAI